MNPSLASIIVLTCNGREHLEECLNALKAQTCPRLEVIEEIYQARKYTDKFSEVPFVLTGREVGTSKFNYTPRVLWDYLKYALKSVFWAGRKSN